MTARRYDVWHRHWICALENVELARVAADGDPALAVQLDDIIGALRRASEHAMDSAAGHWRATGENDLPGDPLGGRLGAAVLARLQDCAEAIATRLDQPPRQALVEAAEASARLVGQGGATRRLVAQTLAKAAARRGMRESHARLVVLRRLPRHGRRA